VSFVAWKSTVKKNLKQIRETFFAGSIYCSVETEWAALRRFPHMPSKKYPAVFRVSTQ
jgi:hypothetical protein